LALLDLKRDLLDRRRVRILFRKSIYCDHKDSL
jgi:hypothetical protein